MFWLVCRRKRGKKWSSRKMRLMQFPSKLSGELTLLHLFKTAQVFGWVGGANTRMYHPLWSLPSFKDTFIVHQRHHKWPRYIRHRSHLHSALIFSFTDSKKHIKYNCNNYNNVMMSIYTVYYVPKKSNQYSTFSQIFCHFLNFHIIRSHDYPSYKTLIHVCVLKARYLCLHLV